MQEKIGGKIGGKIKELRINQGLTLKDLSEKTNLSISFLSMVERGLTSLAIGSLESIAQALGQNISSFFTDQEGNASKKEGKYAICRSYEQQNIRQLDSKCVYAPLTDEPLKGSFDPMQIMLLPSQSRDEVLPISHNGEKFIYVLEGILTISLEDKEYQLYPGDSYHSIGDTVQNFANFSNSVVKALCILYPSLSQTG